MVQKVVGLAFQAVTALPHFVAGIKDDFEAAKKAPNVMDKIEGWLDLGLQVIEDIKKVYGG